MSSELVKRIIALEVRLDRLRLPEHGWTPHFLAEPYTNTTFDGDSFSDVAALTKIENTSWSTTIPADAKALIIRLSARDSGSAAATDINFALYSTAAATNAALVVWPTGTTNDAFASIQGIVPCTDGDIWYTCNASGASTLDVWLHCIGYWT